jgi:hypothetical protein
VLLLSQRSILHAHAVAWALVAVADVARLADVVSGASCILRTCNARGPIMQPWSIWLTPQPFHTPYKLQHALLLYYFSVQRWMLHTWASVSLSCRSIRDEFG